ncbi:MAG: hypothetical protein QNJ40_21035 [Xanthomonadales bacterium]|nr:hypothetical protein [Xanthomonadales bacterium]
MLKPLLTFLAPIALALAACSGNAPRLEPPQLSVVEIQLNQARSSMDVRLRLANTAARKLPADQLRFAFEIDGNELGTFEPDVSYDIPALGSEVLEFSAAMTPAVAAAFQVLDRGGRSQLPYSINGELVHSDGQGRMPVESGGFISPTPGKPASYR